MFIKRSPNPKKAYTLAEFVVAAGIFSLAGLAVMTLFGFSSRSFAALNNYASLDKANRQAMDQLTREIRQAKQVTNYTTNSITILNGDSVSITYQFSPSSKQMIRTTSTGETKVLLNDCSLLAFSLFKRVPIGGTYDAYPVADTNWSTTVKVIQLTWKTSRTLPTSAVNSENIQTARIVIRKQDDGVAYGP